MSSTWSTLGYALRSLMRGDFSSWCLTKLHSRSVALTFVVTAALVTCALGWGIDLALGPADVEALSASHGHEDEHSHGFFAWGAAAVLGLLTVWVLLRQGPRAFLGQLGGGQGHSHGPEDHSHHGHGHGHHH